MVDLNNTQWLDALPGMVFVKDTESRYFYLNQLASRFFCYKNPDDFLHSGGTDYHINSEAANFADKFIEQDKKIIKSSQSCKTLGLYGFDKWRLMLGEKKPLYGKTNTVIGIICYFQDITDSRAIDTLLMADHSSDEIHGQKNICYQIANDYEPLKLSTRQVECLYYMIRGHSAASIANKLGISRRTVESYINEIKLKMSCQNKTEIIEKAIHMGFSNMLPESLLGQVGS